MQLQIFSVAQLPGLEIVVVPSKVDGHPTRLRIRQDGRDIAESMVPTGCDLRSFVAGLLEGIAFCAARATEHAEGGAK